MNLIDFPIPWRVRQRLIARHFVRNGALFGSIPKIIGYLPDIRNSGRMYFGKLCTFKSFRLRHHIVAMKGAELEVGSGSFLNDGVAIFASERIIIGPEAKIGHMVYIYDTNFHEVSPDHSAKRSPVVIGENVWIGARSIILPGSTVGNHAVIAAGSVVIGDVPSRTVAAGSPAKVVRTFDAPAGWVRR